MKVLLISLLVFLSAISNSYATVTDIIERGKQKVVLNSNYIQNLVNASSDFQLAFTTDPNNQEAAFYYALSLLASLFDVQASYDAGLPIDNLSELLDLLGISREGRDVLNWHASFIRDESGKIQIGSNDLDGEAFRTYISKLVIDIQKIKDYLNKITANFNSTLMINNGNEVVEIDYGDVLLLKSILDALSSLFSILMSYDLNVDIFLLNNFKTISQILDEYPNLLNLHTDGPTTLRQAKDFTLMAINEYLAASEFMRSETDVQSDDLIHLSESLVEAEYEFRKNLQQISASITEGTPMAIDTFDVNLNKYFEDPIGLRRYLPQFRGNRLVCGSFIDPTFNGIVSNNSNLKIYNEIKDCDLVFLDYNLDIFLDALLFEDSLYDVKLMYWPNPADPGGFYWQLSSVYNYYDPNGLDVIATELSPNLDIEIYSFAENGNLYKVKLKYIESISVPTWKLEYIDILP